MSFPSSMIQILILVLVTLSGGAIYRIYFHALRRFPGPRLAAMTWWYRAFYDIYKGGQWLENLRELHEKYGPIVRVGPNELHFSDPNAYSGIYASGRSLTKDFNLYTCADMDLSILAVTDPTEAQKRRNLMGPFFSRSGIAKLEPVIQTLVDTLISKLQSYENKEPANLSRAFHSVTFDIITAYCFATSSRTLEAEHFAHEFIVSLEAAALHIWIFKHFPLIKKLIVNLPASVAVFLTPNVKPFLEQQRLVLNEVDELLRDPTALGRASYETIYDAFLAPEKGTDKRPPVTRRWLFDEGMNLRFAGTDPTANAVMITTVHVLRNRGIYDTLSKELVDVWPDRDSAITHSALEKLPYLTSVIKEGLRLSFGVVTPLARVVGKQGANIGGVHVPPKTVVGMSTVMVHLNPELFPEPEVFRPERWLDSDGELEKYLVAFSRGPRMCLGIQLAWCELYVILGNLFRKLDLEEDETRPADLSFREFLLPHFTGAQLYAHVGLKQL